jgi:flagella basal body P-ring formation protein FlgA
MLIQLAAAALILFVAQSIPALAAQVNVTLAPQAQVAPCTPVRLNDVANLRGKPDVAQRIGNVVVMSSLQPGQRKTLLRSDIERHLLELGLAAKARVIGDKSEVVGKCRVIAVSELESAAVEYLLRQLPHDNRTYEAVVERPPKPIVVAPYNLINLSARLLNSRPQPGLNTIALDVVADGRVVATTSTALMVKAVGQTLVATRTIRQGEPLDISNTTWAERDLTRVPDAIRPADNNTATEWIAARSLREGSVITLRDVKQPPLVHKDDTVTLSVMCGCVALRVTAQAREDGRLGEIVRVRSSVSTEDVRARVTGPGRVEINR